MSNTVGTRRFSRMDSKRVAINLGFGVAAFAAWYFLFPILQSFTLPAAPGGASGPWVIRPIFAVHFCACAFAAAVTVPLLTIKFRAKWRAEDQAAGTRFEPARGARKIIIYVKGFLLLIVYGLALFVYLCSWTLVDDAGIHQRLAIGTRHTPFAQVISLQTIPSGMRSDKRVINGPWYTVNLPNEMSANYSFDNEGLQPADIANISNFIAAKTGKQWELYPDARQRK